MLPDLITALCCWLPLGIAGTVWFVRNGIHWKDIAGGLIILAALTVLLVQMPERLLEE
jgi:membrane protein YdbS with pleckstrin-like domain